jgi:hypothetical protein
VRPGFVAIRNGRYTVSFVGSPVACATHASTLRIAIVRTGILLSLELLALTLKVPWLAAIEASPLFCT